jgi:RNA recognition motif-containing protein
MQDSQAVNNNKLYVGNLPWSMTNEQLAELFGQYGEIVADSAVIITDRMSGRSKGFGFVEFVNEADAQAALEATNGYEVDGRPLKVTIARPKAPRENNGFGGGNRGGFGGRDRRPSFGGGNSRGGSYGNNFRGGSSRNYDRSGE